MEMDINYIAPIMISKAMALLNKSSEPAIIMISSGLAYIPMAMLGTYCALKLPYILQPCLYGTNWPELR